MLETRFGKIALVVLGVILMITFVLPAGIQGLAGSGGSVGEIEGGEVDPQDVRRAAGLLGAAGDIILTDRRTGQAATLPQVLLGTAADELRNDPVAFHLLLREAADNGVAVTDQSVVEFLGQFDARVRLSRDEADGPVEFSRITGQDARGRVILAAKSVIDVSEAARQYGDFVKVSRPVADFVAAQQFQEVALDAATFDAADYLDQVETPSAEAVQGQYERFRDEPAGDVSDDNPFGFGYRRPDRVKLGYLVFAAETARQTLRDRLLAQPLTERELALYREWKESAGRFGPATTQPATRPTTVPATLPADADPLTTANPEVARFLNEQAADLAGTEQAGQWAAYVQQHDEALAAYVNQQADELRVAALKRAQTLAASDARQYDAAAAAGRRAPETRAGEPVDSPRYLEALADAVAEQEGLRPDVREYNRDFTPVADLSDPEFVGPIGGAVFVANGQAIRLGQYVGGFALPLLEGDARERAERTPLALDLYEPAQPMLGGEGDAYLFRLNAAEPAAPPAELAAVEEEVVEDLRRKAAYELALADARSLAERAEGSTLQAVAPDQVRSAEAFTPTAGPLDPAIFGGELPVAGRSQLANGIYALLPAGGVLQNDVGEPGVIEIPSAGRAVAAQVTEVSSQYPDAASRAALLAQIRRQLADQPAAGGGLLGEFLDPDNVRARAGFQPARGDSEDAEPAS